LAGLSACATEPLTSPTIKKRMTHDEIMVKQSPKDALRPGTDPWGGTVTRSANGTLLAAALHDDNVLNVWHINADRVIRDVGQSEVGYHPDSVASMGGDVVAVAVEGAGKIAFWRVSETLAPVKISEIASPFPTRDIVTYDLDADGTLDLILAPYKGTEIAVLWGEGKFQFSAPQKLAAAQVPWHPRVVDWNSDGKPDLIWSDWDTGSARVYLNQGQRQFKLTMLQSAQKGAPRQLGVGDIDKDGKPDAVMAMSMSTSKAARILYNRGTNAPLIEDVPAPAWGYVAAEVMDDGTLVLAEEGRVILARKDQGAWNYRVLPAGSLPSPMLLNDLDADGQQDLVVFNSANGGTTVLFGPLWDNAKPFSMPSSTK
jgi:hypothetical protein